MIMKILVPMRHGQNLHAEMLEALAAATRAVESATPETPALGGALYSTSGSIIGSYITEFKGTTLDR